MMSTTLIHRSYVQSNTHYNSHYICRRVERTICALNSLCHTAYINGNKNEYIQEFWQHQQQEYTPDENSDSFYFPM